MHEHFIKESSLFFTRNFVILSGNFTKAHCSICNGYSNIVGGKGKCYLSCYHMEQCVECKEYHLEKLLRCSNCTIQLLGEYPQACSDTCNRNYVTIKSTAVCILCSTNLMKECRKCKTNPAIIAAKQQLRNNIYLFVRSPSTIFSTEKRPCSHYTVCKYCNKNYSRGHKGNAVCKPCKLKSKSSRPKEFTNNSFEMDLNPLQKEKKKQEKEEQLKGESLSMSNIVNPLKTEIKLKHQHHQSNSFAVSPRFNPIEGKVLYIKDHSIYNVPSSLIYNSQMTPNQVRTTNHIHSNISNIPLLPNTSHNPLSYNTYNPLFYNTENIITKRGFTQ